MKLANIEVFYNGVKVDEYREAYNGHIDGVAIAAQEMAEEDITVKVIEVINGSTN